MITTDETLSVNGTTLNTLAINIESISGRLRVPGFRTENLVLPGRHGSLRTVRKFYEEGQIVLPMWVRGCTEDGEIPTDASQREEFYRNIDTLTKLFRPGDGLLEVVHTLPDGSTRRVLAECTEAINFSVVGGNPPLAKFSVALRVPSVFWEDVLPVTQDLTFGHLGPVPVLSGTTAPIEDAIFEFVGPVSTPRVESYMGSAPLEDPIWFRYSGTVDEGETLTVDCSTWQLTGGGGLVPDYSFFTHSGSPRWLEIKPGSTGEDPSLYITGSNTSATSKVVVTARRKYLVG